MEKKFNAICIRQTAYRDNDKMLSLYTLEDGLVDCVLRGVKSPKAKLKFAGEVFCFAEYVMVEKSDRRTVIEVNEIDSFYGIRNSIDKLYSASSVIEFLRAFGTPSNANYDLFLASVNTLKVIDRGNNEILALLKFLHLGLGSCGFGIEIGDCVACGKKIENRVFFDLDSPSFYCKDCASITNIEMRIATYNLLYQLKDLSFDDIKNDNIKSDSILKDKNISLYALKFFDFILRDKVGVNIKSIQTLLLDTN